MRQVQTLAQQLQRNHCHDTRRAREHAAVQRLARSVALAAARNPEPEGGHASAERLADAAEERGPEHGLPPAVNGEVKG